MSRVHRWAGVADETTATHTHIIMRDTPSGDDELWRIPLHRLPVPVQDGDIVRVRICPRRLRVTVFDRQGRRRA